MQVQVRVCGRFCRASLHTEQVVLWPEETPWRYLGRAGVAPYRSLQVAWLVSPRIRGWRGVRGCRGAGDRMGMSSGTAQDQEQGFTIRVTVMVVVPIW